jgi:hypothetical protein
MKISTLLSGIKISLTNEENDFVKKHKDQVSLYSLDQHDTWLARNLVRKGIYKISEDHKTLIKLLDEKSA